MDSHTNSDETVGWNDPCPCCSKAELHVYEDDDDSPDNRSNAAVSEETTARVQPTEEYKWIVEGEDDCDDCDDDDCDGNGGYRQRADTPHPDIEHLNKSFARLTTDQDEEAVFDTPPGGLKGARMAFFNPANRKQVFHVQDEVFKVNDEVRDILTRGEVCEVLRSGLIISHMNHERPSFRGQVDGIDYCVLPSGQIMMSRLQPPPSEGQIDEVDYCVSSPYWVGLPDKTKESVTDETTVTAKDTETETLEDVVVPVPTTEETKEDVTVSIHPPSELMESDPEPDNVVIDQTDQGTPHVYTGFMLDDISNDIRWKERERLVTFLKYHDTGDTVAEAMAHIASYGTVQTNFPLWTIPLRRGHLPMFIALMLRACGVHLPDSVEVASKISGPLFRVITGGISLETDAGESIFDCPYRPDDEAAHNMVEIWKDTFSGRVMIVPTPSHAKE